MLSSSRGALRSAVLALVAVLAPAPLRAADPVDVDIFLPPDTEIFVRVNLRQVIDSKLAKSGVEQLRELVKQFDDLNEAFKDLGFDPFQDLDTITFAAPNTNEPDRMLVILHGKYKLDKFKAKGADIAKNIGEFLKLHKVADGTGGQVTVYEVTAPGQDQALFVALPNETTLIVSPGKDYVADAIKRGKAKGPAALKNKEFQALLAKMDPKQTLALAGLGDALAKNVGDAAIKEVLAKVDAVGGGVTLGDDIKLELVIGTKTLQDAKELKATVNDYVTKGLALIGLLALQQKELAPVVDVLKSVRCNANGKVVTIKAEISAEVIEAIQKALGGN
jgi:hypothetical protein